MSAADELMWMNFETRMRGIVRTLLEPIVDISRADRSGMLILEANFGGHDDRLAKLEEALFNTSVNNEETLFEKMAKKIKQNEIHMKTTIKEIRDEQREKYTDIDGILFTANQKIKSCLNMKDEVLNLEREQVELKKFIEAHSTSTINEHSVIREVIAETNDRL